MHSSISEGRSVLLLVNGASLLEAYGFLVLRLLAGLILRLSNEHTIVSLSLNADEILDLST